MAPATSEPWERLNQPQSFGAYTLLAQLGRGGTASVFLGRKPDLDRWLAIKRLHPHLIEYENNVEMFKNEARHLTQLEHPSITELIDYGFMGDEPYLVFPYLHGVPLNNLLARLVRTGNTLPLPVAIRIFHQVSSALKYAHEAQDSHGHAIGLIHRDISPQNIFLLFDGRVMLLDFGIAKGTTDPKLTATGTLKGKLGYMSPEQAEGRPLDQRTDIFSLGIVMWESLCGRRLFRRENDVLTLMEITNGPIPSPRDIAPHVPEKLSQLVIATLERDVSKRIATAEVVIDALAHVELSPHALSGVEHLSRLTRRVFPERMEPDDAGFELLEYGAMTETDAETPTLYDELRGVRPLLPRVSSSLTTDAPDEGDPEDLRHEETIPMSPVHPTDSLPLLLGEVTKPDIPVPAALPVDTSDSPTPHIGVPMAPSDPDISTTHDENPERHDETKDVRPPDNTSPMFPPKTDTVASSPWSQIPRHPEPNASLQDTLPIIIPSFDEAPDAQKKHLQKSQRIRIFLTLFIIAASFVSGLFARSCLALPPAWSQLFPSMTPPVSSTQPTDELQPIENQP